MSLLFIESFDHFTTTTQAAAGKWSSIYGVNNGSFGVAGSGRNGSFGFHAINGAGGTNALMKVFPLAKATLVAGVAMRHALAGTIDAVLIGFIDSTNGEQVSLRYSASGHKLYVSRNGTLLALGSAVLSDAVFYYVEFKATINGATGTTEVHVNGVADPALTLSGVNTRGSGTNNSADAVRLGPVGTTNVFDFDFDDFYVCDTAGAVNNDFLGDVRVQCLFPDAIGAHSQWAPTPAGANYTAVNEVSPNDDTSYVSDLTPGDLDSYGFSDLSPSTGAVKGVQTVPYARKDDAGTRTIAPMARHGVTDYPGPNHNISNTYAYFPDVWETNPGTGLAWTVADVNADEFGVKVVA